MPGFAFPPVGRLGFPSPPSSVLCSTKTAPLPLSDRFACRSLPDTLLASVRSWCPPRAQDRVEAPRSCQGLWSPGPPVRDLRKEAEGSPKFPSYPCRYMPRSPTPVEAHLLANAQLGLLPSGTTMPSAFPSVPPEGYPRVHNDKNFGAQSRGLYPCSFQLRTPIAGFARGVLYRLAG
jgi:hypothetical protein